MGEWFEGTARTWLRRDGVLAVLLAARCTYRWIEVPWRDYGKRLVGRG